ncbi:MAG: hypothetical protein LUC34_05515 [Campylobacter sp.]|nr:hypothetical protein [Campylobacter sp.]
MILCFEFNHSNLNDNSAFFLNFYAQKSELAYGIDKNGYDLRLYVQGDQEELLKFSDDISTKIPHSIFLQSSRVFVSQTLGGKHAKFKNLLSNITPNMVDDFKNGKITVCENGVFSDIAIKSDDGFTNVTQSNFDNLLNFAFKEIIGGKNVIFKDINNEFDMFKFDELSDKFDILTPTNLCNLPKIFIVNQNEQIALASYEKPAVWLKTNAIYRQNHVNSPHFFKVAAARDIFIYALCEKLFANGVSFISMRVKKPLFTAIALENSYIFLNSNAYYDGEISDVINFAEDKNLANFNLASNLALGSKNENRLRIFLSKFKNDEIKIYRKNDDFSVLNFNIPNSFEKLFAKLKNQDGADRLLANYELNFTLPNGKIELASSFFSLFCILGVILGYGSDLEKSGAKLLQNAMDFNGAKGPRLDFKMLDRSEFDVLKFIRSAMSFKLAGVDDRLLCYGCIESFVYFLSDFCDALKDDFGAFDAILQGSLFECKTLANLILKHLRVSTNARFSKELSLEEMF